MQMQADFSRVPVDRPDVTETTALGAAGLAGIAVSVWQNAEQFAEIRRSNKTFSPEMSEEHVNIKIKYWQAAVSSARYNAGQLEK
jgi:glycerol kinase